MTPYNEEKHRDLIISFLTECKEKDLEIDAHRFFTENRIPMTLLALNHFDSIEMPTETYRKLYYESLLNLIERKAPKFSEECNIPLGRAKSLLHDAYFGIQ